MIDKKTRQYRETRKQTVQEISVVGSTDPNGYGWFVGWHTPRGSYWVTPSEARQFAKTLIRLSYKSKVKTYGKKKS
jgi:hypothetical protein